MVRDQNTYSPGNDSIFTELKILSLGLIVIVALKLLFPQLEQATRSLYG